MFHLWGAGGGGGADSRGPRPGGAGGFTKGSLPIVPGKTYTVVVPRGGNPDDCSLPYGGGGLGTCGGWANANGGGYAGVFESNHGQSSCGGADQSTAVYSACQVSAVLIAGGGGGGGTGGGAEAFSDGGAGGGLVGTAPGVCGTTTLSSPGTQTAGGLGALANGASAGSALRGRGGAHPHLFSETHLFLSQSCGVKDTTSMKHLERDTLPHGCLLYVANARTAMYSYVRLCTVCLYCYHGSITTAKGILCTYCMHCTRLSRLWCTWSILVGERWGRELSRKRRERLHGGETLRLGGDTTYPGGGGGGGYFGGGGGGYNIGYHHVGGAGGSGFIHPDVVGGEFVSHDTYAADPVATDQEGYALGRGRGVLQSFHFCFTWRFTHSHFEQSHSTRLDPALLWRRETFQLLQCAAMHYVYTCVHDERRST